MKIDLSIYEENYHKKDGGQKFVDNWNEGIKIIPFTNHTNRSGYDKSCSIQGTTGEFFRALSVFETAPIIDFEKTADELFRPYLEKQKSLGPEQREELISVFRDILFINGELNASNVCFLKYMPAVPQDENLTESLVKKYEDGQRRMGEYLYSMVKGSNFTVPENGDTNVFIKVLRESLKSGMPDTKKENEDAGYYILPFVREAFQKDLAWLFQKDETIILKYIHLLLHFYACYSIIQSLSYLSSSKNESCTTPISFYFILASEKVSQNHEAVIKGWDWHLPKQVLDRLFAKSQALDIANAVLGGNVGFYPDILAKLRGTPFEENRPLLQKLIESYKEKKTALLTKRDSEEKRGRKQAIEDIGDLQVTSYEGFLHTLEKLCVALLSSSYTLRLRKKVIDLLSIRFLQRRRGTYVLTLDKEMLMFLVTLLTKGDKIKLEEMYRRFNQFGINFNRNTRMAIEDYLLKLNVLIRKSDSGEAQYVKAVL